VATPLRLLLVEDSEDDAQLVLRHLRGGGFDPTWERVDDRPSLLEALERETWDIIISDHRMPRFSAPEALALVKERELDVPFLVVSGSIGEEEAVAAMRAGARDYLMKDKLTRLVAAVERELQESENHRMQRAAERKRWEAEQAIAQLSRRDRLTDLPNRTALEERLEVELHEAARSQTTLALLHIAISRYREIEHTLGHSHGNAVIQAVATRIQDLLGPEELLARLLPDEFALLMVRADAEGATSVANRIFAALEEPVRAAGLPILVEPIMGISLFPGHGRESGVLLRAAAVAGRAARSLGVGHAVYSAERDVPDSRSLELLGDLRQAIEENQLFLQYQPCVELRAQRIVGVEALVRWRHPRFGLVPPSQFIPLAERTALVQPLTRWILNEALRCAQDWHERGLSLFTSINLSARNLHAPDLIPRIQGLRETWGIPWDVIEFEVTESALMKDPRRAADALERVCAFGASLAIDDFGTGYSSLVNLRKLPFSKIKIDKSFVFGMRSSDEDAAIVQAIIELARTLGLKSHAEGVEDQATLDRLAALGCDHAQGFHIARPLDRQDLLEWIHASPWGSPLS
jgi:diguanylate cyclase (GGDEF)-like protein